MVENSKIEWTDHTFNPWIGCSKVSPGCDNCYAERFAARFGTAKWGSGEPRKLSSESYWKQPLKWNESAKREGRRQRVFCASLADVFDNEVPEYWRYELFDLIERTPELDWLLLTKRIGNVKDMLPPRWMPLPDNVWLGISIVNQQEADRDIPKLLATPARVRFLSMEPLLGPVNLDRIYSSYVSASGARVQTWDNCLNGQGSIEWDESPEKLEENPYKINWIIVGGESGPNARPMNPDWARKLRDQCINAGTPFLFKQWGEWAPGSLFPEYIPSSEYCDFDEKHAVPEETAVWKVGKKQAGRLLDGKEWTQFPVPS